MNKSKQEFNPEFTLAWIFTSELVLRPDEYRGWERATKNIIPPGNIKIL